MSPSKPAANAHDAFIALGSNLGDRFGNLAQAVERLRRIPGVSVAAVSSVYSTAPVGMPGEPDFLNAVVEIRTEEEPEDLLDRCLGIEKAMGRVRTGRWGSRTIDLDVLLFGDLRLEGARLTVPHPRMKERAFVLAPLAEIAPGLMLDGRTAAAWAAEADGAGVRRLDEPRLAGSARVSPKPPAGR